MEIRSAQEIWETALGELQLQVNKSNYKTWLEKTKGLSFHDNQFVIGVPSIFVAEYLDKNQSSLIEKTLANLTHCKIKSFFRVESKYQNLLGGYGIQEEIPTITQMGHPAFNPKYTFESFIVGDCNHLAYAAAQAIATKPGHSYNPLFIYGGTGLGKTHLLHAIGHVALVNNIRTIYVSGEQFTNEFVNAIRDRNTKEFRNKYRSVDMLLIDDIHFISGKEQTEESFFHTFNELHNANSQIALTSDTPPKSMLLLQERLRSRFEWGLVANIQPPDFETRLTILQAKVKEQGVNVVPDVLEFIAHQIRQSIRELEGALNRVIAYSGLLKTVLTPALAARAIADIGKKTPTSPHITSDLIIETVARSFEITSIDLKSQKRDKETALARRIAIYLLRKETSYSLAQIGKILGDRDHSAIGNAYHKITAEIDVSPYLSRKIANIYQEINKI